MSDTATGRGGPPAGALYLRDQEAAELLGLSVRSVRYLVEEGQLRRVYPRPRAARITRASLDAYCAKVEAGTARQAVKAAQQEATTSKKEVKRGGLLGRWGLLGSREDERSRSR